MEIVNANMLTNNLIQNLSVDQARMSRFENEISSGQSINQPSDNPAGVQQELRLQKLLAQNQQYQTNAQNAAGFLQETGSALSTLIDILNKADQLAVEGANGTMNASDRQNLATQVGALFQQAVQTGNTRFGSTYVFGGTQDVLPPYILEPTGTIQDNSNGLALNREVGPGIVLAVNTQGSPLLNNPTPSATSPPGVFQVLQQLQNDLAQNNTAALASDLTAVQGALERVTVASTKSGSTLDEVNQQLTRLTNQSALLQQLDTQTAGADTAKVIADFENVANSYRQALAAGAQIIQPSLMQFLK